MTEPLWQPPAERIASANMTAFLGRVRQRVPTITDYPSLYEWSVEEPAAFWRLVWDFCGIVASREPRGTVENDDRMPGARWFPGARLNFAENLLRHRGERPALVFWNEAGRQSEHSYGELHAAVSRLAQALRRQGVGPGDRVAGFMPNLPHTVAAMLATASLGAVWSSCSPDFGAKGVLDRFGQIEPKVLFTADGYRFGGKTFDSLGRIRRVLEAIPAIERVVVVPYVDSSPDLSFSGSAVLWSDFVAGCEPGEIDFAQLPFDHPLYIMYSSGTTGLPKCMVHGAGGTLIQHLKELVLHTDLTSDDRIFYFTTCGWMMWNWLVSSLGLGATVLLYDGSPMSPRPDILFELAERERMTVFGTSAKYLSLVEKEGVRPRRGRDLQALRTILSTGSPLAPESYDFVYREISEDVCLSSISGGTDLISCFALGNPIAPVWRGELQTRGLGMKVEVYDPEGRPVVGEKGELVCTAPFPSMPVEFWNDPEGQKYHRAYFDFFPGVWRHGDWAEVTERGGMIIYGRSDATLNPGGVRIGTAEIYRQVEQNDEVVESLVIGQDFADDVRIVLFVRLREGLELDDELAGRIRQQVKTGASPHHVPKKIIQVADIPRTLSGKITELAVREVIHGRPVKNADALANPEALELFRDLPELKP
ncbi:MAG: acetoacetate--CoA ligase [bacterium]|nr:acetoacetate--CoA ligase [bacterium]